ncbi:hypothetical protein LTR64_006511 [Lithohypha guttulata]|uniref:uncharacterized protein n=1 Tax=Lithohypha guttulata TaxID=1690604 RepID=UPI002DE02B9F|nr:hypothetical protein LTR51_004931 [Lithohypha guttulata]
MTTSLYVGRRLSFEGSLCTVRYTGSLAGTKGEWLGVEWDDPSRGKHDGKHKDEQVFTCLSSSSTPASFIRPSRKPDAEQTLLEAIKSKYGGDSTNNSSNTEIVIISGKVAQEVGFDKIAQQQAELAELRIVLVDQLVVNGIASRGASSSTIAKAQAELSTSCPNITELDISYNTIENWQDVADICSALPKLRTLRAGGSRFRTFGHDIQPSPFAHIKELHLEDCLLSSNQIVGLLRDLSGFPHLTQLFLSANQLSTLFNAQTEDLPCISSLKSLVLENNSFRDLDCLIIAVAVFPNIESLSLQANKICDIGPAVVAHKHIFPQITTLNLSHNLIPAFSFIDYLPKLLPNLSSLRITNNPIFLPSEPSSTTDSRSSDKHYFLTLARLPTLKTLNYTSITPRDREEGEIYFLSVVEKDLKAHLLKAEARAQLIAKVEQLYPRYEALCKKYSRESVVEQLLSSDPSSEVLRAIEATKLLYPVGSIAARLVKGIFYIPNTAIRNKSEAKVELQIPDTIPVTRLLSILLRQPGLQAYLKPMQFKLIYESKELDPVDTTAESTTRSAVYSKTLTAEEKQTLWREWGDWDADTLVEERLNEQESTTSADTEAEHWTEDGQFCIKEGRRWKRRETEIPHALKRGWGDWLDGAKEVRIRIEPFDPLV